MLTKHTPEQEDELYELLAKIRCKGTGASVKSEDCHPISFIDDSMCGDCKAFWNRAAEIQGLSVPELITQYMKETQAHE